MRQVIVIIIGAGFIAYDLFLLNGRYFRLVLAEASSLWNSIEGFFLGLL